MSTMREDFEAWATTEGMNLIRHDARPAQYSNATVQGRWVTWQAATERAAKHCDDIAELEQEMHNTQAEQAADACAAAIRAQAGGEQT